jgi:hypothetical protein
MMAIDHVILLVDDLDEAADLMLEQHGLASVAGGRHPGVGTCNRIVPLGDAYLELMAVADAEEAAASPVGRWALAAERWPPRIAAICMRADDLDAVARRLGLEPAPGSRARPDGSALTWRTVGLEHLVAPGGLPLFFIEWDTDAEARPGREPVAHRVAPTGRLQATLSGDPDVIGERLGGHLPVDIVEGPPRVARVVVETRQGEIIL